MIRFIKGIFHPMINGSAIIENSSGVGFEIHIPANSSLYKNTDGDEVMVYTSMIVREDNISLYGFSDRESLELFELLITVNGIGAKAGMSIMSIMPPNELKRAIAAGDVKAVSQANGVGKKTAERIILELKDKVGTFEETEIQGDEIQAMVQDERNEAVAALVALGYTRNEALSAVEKVREQGETCEFYIKNALRNLF